MRLKQLLVVLVPLLFCAVIAGAAETRLKSVTATTQGGATVVALETVGPFTHSEYRPQPSMVLVVENLHHWSSRHRSSQWLSVWH